VSAQRRRDLAEGLSYEKVVIFLVSEIAEFELTEKEKSVATHMLASAGTVGSTRNEPCEREAGSVYAVRFSNRGGLGGMVGAKDKGT
jgi:hypothetical protein